MKTRHRKLATSTLTLALFLSAQSLFAQQDHSSHGQDGDNEHTISTHQDAGSDDVHEDHEQNSDGSHHMMNRGNGDGGGGMMNRGNSGGMMENMGSMHEKMHGNDSQLGAGQAAFDLIKQVVAQLQANPDTDWESVNIDILREHLMDMNQVTLYAEVESSEVDGGARFEVTGSGRTRDAIKRMVPAHATQISAELLGWSAETEETRSGATLTVTSDNAADVVKIRALGFIGFMALGDHHTSHHLMMAGVPVEEPGGMNHSEHEDQDSGDSSGHDH